MTWAASCTRRPGTAPSTCSATRSPACTRTPGACTSTFRRAAPQTFDLVIGADGLHSAVRELAFGDHPDPVHDLGLYVSIFGVPDRYGLDHEGLLYSVPGRTAAIFSAPGTDGAVAQFFFTAPDRGRIEYDYHDTTQQQKILADAFEGVGWQVPDLLGQMPAAADFYFDSVSQVRLDRWSSGRVALIGDAGYAAGPGGNGTGTAVVAAYVLAGELAVASGDYGAAFARYEHLLRGYVARGQKQALGGRDFLAPATAKKIRQRDRFFRMLPYLPPARSLIRHLSTGPRPPSSCPSTPREPKRANVADRCTDGTGPRPCSGARARPADSRGPCYPAWSAR